MEAAYRNADRIGRQAVRCICFQSQSKLGVVVKLNARQPRLISNASVVRQKSRVNPLEVAVTAPTLVYMRWGWPLTGRSKEMRLIEAALSDRDCSGIVVCGAAGVGKSRIAREAMTSAASNGCEVRWVVATNSARALPLGALSSWAGPAGGDSLQLVRGVIESLTSAPSGATVVVGVDDAPLLDDLSIFVVHQIVQRGGAKVVFTVRDGEPVPAAIQEVWNEGTVNLSNPRAIFAGSPPRFTRSRVTYEAYVASRTSTRTQVDSAAKGGRWRRIAPGPVRADRAASSPERPCCARRRS